jgi:hypothetical protein
MNGVTISKTEKAQFAISKKREANLFLKNLRRCTANVSFHLLLIT